MFTDSELRAMSIVVLRAMDGGPAISHDQSEAIRMAHELIKEVRSLHQKMRQLTHETVNKPVVC